LRHKTAMQKSCANAYGLNARPPRVSAPRPLRTAQAAPQFQSIEGPGSRTGQRTKIMPAAAQVHSAEVTGERTSSLLLRAVRGEADRLTVAQVADALEARAFGLATLIFSLPSLVPMPPGVPTVVGIALLIVSVQMVAGRQELWLPGLLSRRSFSRQALVSAFEKMAPRLEAVEKIAR